MSTPKVGNKAKARRSMRNKAKGKYARQSARTAKNKLRKRIRREKHIKAAAERRKLAQRSK